jgi:hypothetical protein
VVSLPRLTSTRAMYRALEHLEADLGLAVYELRKVEGVNLAQLAVLGSIPGLVDSPGPHLVQVQVGKRPPRSRGMSVDKRRVPAVCHVVAAVDPRDHHVHLVTRSQALQGLILVDEGKDTGDPPNGAQTAAPGLEAVTGA